jgi:phosphatidylserine decarboxylase
VRLAREGVPFVVGATVLGAGLLTAGAIFGGWWWLGAVLSLPIALWVPWFFRDPVRRGPRGSRLVLAPADGRVVSVTSVEEPDFVIGTATRVSVFMNVLNVHVNRYPASGLVAYREYRPGAFLNATRDKASEKNERMSLGIRTDQGPVLVRQIAGLIARRIVTDAQVGDRALQGERLGMIRFGSRVDTFLPLGARIAVSVGAQTRAGVTTIAEWPT